MFIVLRADEYHSLTQCLILGVHSSEGRRSHCGRRGGKLQGICHFSLPGMQDKPYLRVTSDIEHNEIEVIGMAFSIGAPILKTDRRAAILMSGYICAIILLGSCQLMAGCSRNSGTSRLDVTIKTEGNFVAGKAWDFHVADDGKAQLIIHDFPHDLATNFRVTPVQLDSLRSAINREEFFDLSQQYGDEVTDSSVRTIRIRQGEATKVVVLKFLRTTDSQLSEVKRALRIWLIVRHWFKHPQAVDHTRLDQQILNAR